MSFENDNRWEAEIDRTLKALPELHAPETLSRSVMAIIARRARCPWYKQAWQAWPMPLQVVSFGLLAAVMAAICFGVWKLPHLSEVNAATQHVSGWISWVSFFWNIVSNLGTSLLLVAKHLGTPFFVGAFLLISLAWAMCLGLGTACFRLAGARR